MNIWTSDYKLYPKGSLSRISSNPIFRYGTLLKVEFESGLIGYSDLCPYPQLGDPQTKELLQGLRKNERHHLVELSLEYAKKDALARQAGVLLTAAESLKNGYLIQSLEYFDFSSLAELEEKGFNLFKIKVRGNLELFSQILTEFVSQLSSYSKIRLDFNSRLNAESFDAFISRLPGYLLERVEYFEDPISFDLDQWKLIRDKWGVALALDRLHPTKWVNVDGVVDVVVVKPAIESPREKIEFFKNQDMVFTHYMDFPVGQMSALAEAVSWKDHLGSRMRQCGLNALHCFEDSDFSRSVDLSSPFIQPSPGTGIGFDSLLEEILWTPL